MRFIAQPAAIASGGVAPPDLVFSDPLLEGAGAPMRVDVQARITAGGSTIGVLVMHAIGIGT